MTTCTTDSCDRPAYRRGLCSPCYQRWKKARGIVCTIPDCSKPVQAQGLCGMHHMRSWRAGGFEPELPWWTTTADTVGTLCPWCALPGRVSDGGLDGICWAHWVARLNEARLA